MNNSVSSSEDVSLDVTKKYCMFDTVLRFRFFQSWSWPCQSRLTRDTSGGSVGSRTYFLAQIESYLFPLYSS
jgi:hypothetical protein